MPTTIQTDTVLTALRRLGHATNLELYAAITEQLPQLGLTSLHRITARMVERGEIGLAPSDGRQVVLDARPEAHDHFVCTVCGGILDIVLPDSTVELIQGQLGRHLVRDGIVVRGRCERCGPLGAGNSALSQ
jgi:Fur family peroxide stress response transcriptional regulator